MSEEGFSTSYEKLVFVRTYSKWVEQLKRREYWNETVDRYENFFEERVPETHKSEFRNICRSIRDFEIMPSMRALWTAGRALERENVAGFNCASLVVDNIKAFSELLYILLNGTGCGFSVESQFIEKLPEIPEDLQETEETIVFADSKLGWAEGFYKYLRHLYSGCIPNYDLSKIRPKGARLKTFGGRASGPEALEDLILFTKDLFINAVGRKLNSIECHDLCCKVAYIVVVGGVRRSACISLSNLSDQRMAKAKEGKFWEENIQRVMANNSVAYNEKPDHVSFMEEWLNLIKSKSGERGIFNREGAKKFIEHIGRRDSNHDFTVNPCGEILLRPNEFCVKGDTPIIAKDGIYDISDLNNKNTEIWNGNEWTEVTVRKTGENQKMMRVTLSDGSYLDCTPDHKWSIKDRFSKTWSTVEARDLMNFSKYSVQIEPSHMEHPEVGAQIDNAYTIGFSVGDGFVYNGKVGVDLYGEKDNKCPVEGKRWKEYTPKGYNLSKIRVSTDLEPEQIKNFKIDAYSLRQISTWNRDSILNFFAGLADADGSNVETGGIRIYQSDYERLKIMQLLLTKCGIRSSINLSQKKGKETNLGMRKKDLWYLQITECNDIPTHRLDTSRGHKSKYKGKYQNIRNVEYLDGLYDSYCFNEPKTNKAVFGNVLTYQCNLSEVIIRPEDTKKDLCDKVRKATVLGCIQSTLTKFNFLRRIWRKNTEEERLLGVSLTGLRDHPVIGKVSKEAKTWLSEMKQTAIYTAREWSQALEINMPAAITAVKPSGCTSLDTKVRTTDGLKSMSELFSENDIDVFSENREWIEPTKDTFVYDENNEQKKITNFFINGTKPVYEIEDEDGNVYKFTEEHKLKTKEGFKRVDELNEGDDIISFS